MGKKNLVAQTWSCRLNVVVLNIRINLYKCHLQNKFNQDINSNLLIQDIQQTIDLSDERKTWVEYFNLTSCSSIWILKKVFF